MKHKRGTKKERKFYCEHQSNIRTESQKNRLLQIGCRTGNPDHFAVFRHTEFQHGKQYDDGTAGTGTAGCNRPVQSGTGLFQYFMSGRAGRRHFDRAVLGK